jgi:acyl carrier protein
MSQTDPKPSKSDILNDLASNWQDPEEILEQVESQKEARLAPGSDYEPPRTHVEKKLAEIYAELLGREQVGINDNFFEAGGDSILATQVLSRVFNTFQVEIPLEALFSGDFTVAGLSTLIEEYQIKQADEKELADELAELSQLSDEEVKALLAEEEQE